MNSVPTFLTPSLSIKDSNVASIGLGRSKSAAFTGSPIRFTIENVIESTSIGVSLFISLLF